MEEIISKKELRKFGFLIGFGFPILIGWLLPAITGHGFRVWTLIFGITGLILGITAPRLLHYPYKVWMTIGHALGFINSHIILGFVFIIILQPIAYVMRLFGYDPLRLSRRRTQDNTYREYRKDHHKDLTRIF